MSGSVSKLTRPLLNASMSYSIIPWRAMLTGPQAQQFNPIIRDMPAIVQEPNRCLETSWAFLENLFKTRVFSVPFTNSMSDIDRYLEQHGGLAVAGTNVARPGSAYGTGQHVVVIVGRYGDNYLIYDGDNTNFNESMARLHTAAQGLNRQVWELSPQEIIGIAGTNSFLFRLEPAQEFLQNLAPAYVSYGEGSGPEIPVNFGVPFEVQPQIPQTTPYSGYNAYNPLTWPVSFGGTPPDQQGAPAARSIPAPPPADSVNATNQVQDRYWHDQPPPKQPPIQRGITTSDKRPVRAGFTLF